jgi:hypothetical protein
MHARYLLLCILAIAIGIAVNFFPWRRPHPNHVFIIDLLLHLRH